MGQRVRILLLLSLYWLSFMVIARLIFMAYNHDYTAALTTREIFLAALYGFRMDASITGYFIMFSGLLITISVFTASRWVTGTLTFVTLMLLVLCTLITAVDLELYRHWGFRLNTTPFLYIGKEAMGSIEADVIVKATAIIFILLLLYLWIFNRMIRPHLRNLEDVPIRSAVPLLLLTILMFLPIRGSFTVAPMNTGFVYFHNTKPFANHSAVNVVWNFLYTVRKSGNAAYPENFFNKNETARLFKSLYTSSDSSLSILNTNQPNVILVILESFTADVVEPLGGMKGVAPNLSALCHDGVLFTNFYSSGDRTDKGLISILSGFPAQPTTSIIKLPAKAQRLPQLNQYMRRLGYRTSFIYGGDIDFANFRSYLNTSGFDHITTLDDFDSKLYTSKWGVHDHFMFERSMQELDTTSGKFFKTILTLSSHEPFDVPMKPVFKGTDPEAQFINSCYYTDQWLGKFVDYCKKQEWWSNTLMVITADHGHRHPGNKLLHEKERFRIPLLMIGGAVKEKLVIEKTGSQTDIINTLLGQIDKPSPAFTYSKNLLDPGSQSFASYFFNDGYGFLMNDEYVVYDNAGKRFIVGATSDSSVISISKAYQQKLYSDYNSIEKK